jgi:hypothetical protein
VSQHCSHISSRVALVILTLLAIRLAAAPTAAQAANYVAIDLYTLQAPAGLPVIAASDAVAGQVGGDGRATQFDTSTHALLWPGPSGTAVDLSPAGFTSSVINGITPAQQVGEGSTITGIEHALLWNSTATSAIDLHPVALGFTYSRAFATSGKQQVGAVSNINQSGTGHAALWTGTAASAVDLNPAGYDFSLAVATNGSQQAGTGYLPSSTAHAMLWSGTAASAVDLHPASGYSLSHALGVGGGHDVGDAVTTSGFTHAMLWSGTATSAVDLNPLNYTFSQALDANDTIEVGYGYGSVTDSRPQALLWTGSSASAVNLGVLLPESIRVNSKAFSIDAAGNIFGVSTDNSGNIHAVEWSPVPEPASIALIAAGGITLALAAARRRAVI